MRISLLSVIEDKVRVNEAEKQQIEAAFDHDEYRKGDQLLKEGQICKRLYFVEEGTTRTFYYLDGKDVTSWFYSEGFFLSSWYSFLNHQPSFEYIEVLEPSQIRSISYESLQQLYESIPAFERFGRLMIEEQVAFIDYYSKGYMFLSAQDRYEQLLEHFPDVELRVNLGHVASLLGISQETLSRIRSRR